MKKNKKNKTIILIIFSILSIILFSSIAYSAFSSTMNITGIAHARVEANVRITDFKLESTTNATSSYEEFGKNHISTSIDFKDNASATYKIEVTNYGEANIGIYNITGLPETISYELIDYNLKDKICDTSNKCNSFIKKVFYIKFKGNNINEDLIINFDFRVIHNISYINFTGNYKKEIYDQETTSIDISEDSPIFVLVESDKEIYHGYKNNILTLKNVTSNVTVEAIKNVTKTFNYTANVQNYLTPYEGLYKIELWGSGAAQNGMVYKETVGKGAYTSGEIYLNKNTSLYFYVGGADDFNGRGNGEAPGGSATDVRITYGLWDDFNSLKSRIMVAAGGGGGVYSGGDSQIPYIGDSPGDGGGLTGYDARYDSQGYGYEYSGHGATQTSGGKSGIQSNFYELPETANGKFGFGGHGYAIDIVGATGFHACGGGSGYYGGGHGTHPGATWPGGGGGSSFISGHDGCDAIAESSTSTNIVHTNQSNHYSGYKFINTKMIDGRGYNWTNTKGSYVGMPTFDGTSTMTGNTNAGYAKITLIKLSSQYNITYTNISGTYQNTIYKGDDLTVDFGSNAPDNINIFAGETKLSNYTYTNGVLTIPNITNDIEIIKLPTYSYDYTGETQIFTAPVSGTYKIELWGAQGGSYSETYYGGYGAYAVGEINLNSGEILHINVGGEGIAAPIPITEKFYADGGYNGGGSGEAMPNYNNFAAAGGGATHIASTSGLLSSLENNKESIYIVAAGGGGASSRYVRENDWHYASGGPGGGIEGVGILEISNSGWSYASPTGGTQTSGGTPGHHNNEPGATSGTFGQGGFWDPTKRNNKGDYSAIGGGGGFYGGAGGIFIGGSGGSSYIGNQNLFNKHMTCYNCKESDEVSTKTISTSCKSASPNKDCSKQGNGYAKISLIEIN